MSLITFRDTHTSYVTREVDCVCIVCITKTEKSRKRGPQWREGSGGGAVTRVASALILSMTTALRLPAFLCVAGEVHAQASMVAVH